MAKKEKAVEQVVKETEVKVSGLVDSVDALQLRME